MPLKLFPYEYQRDKIAKMPGTFVFGDNVHHKGFKGQAIIRNLPNAYGFPTKWLPLTIPGAYFRDSDPETDKIVNKHLLELETMLTKGRKIWWPQAGIGTGLARWPEFAPEALHKVNNVIQHWLGFYR